MDIDKIRAIRKVIDDVSDEELKANIDANLPFLVAMMADRPMNRGYGMARLEAMIRHSGLPTVVNWLVGVCQQQASDLRAIQGDEAAAQHWETQADILDNAYAAIGDLK